MFPRMIFHLTTNKKMRKNHIRIFNQNKIKTIAKTAFNAKVLKLNNLHIQNDLCSDNMGLQSTSSPYAVLWDNICTPPVIA